MNCKKAPGVAIFLHELHRKVPYLLSCDDKDAMTVKTQKTTEKLQTAKTMLKQYISEKLMKKQSF